MDEFHLWQRRKISYISFTSIFVSGVGNKGPHSAILFVTLMAQKTQLLNSHNERISDIVTLYGRPLSRHI